MSNSNTIESILRSYNSINLQEIKEVALMNRIDTKYVFHKNILSDLLIAARDTYELLKIGDHLAFSYLTKYYDTTDNTMYLRHHNGFQTRYKIRTREYVESATRFLEIKFRNNKRKTDKKRMILTDRRDGFSEEEIRFIECNSPYKANDLNKSVISKFKRITLANRKWMERITIDTIPEFLYEDSKVCLDNLIICEVKKEPGQHMTPMEHLLRNLRINPFRISKYCLGSVLLKKELKSNLYKEKLILLNKKLNNGNAQ